jgi:uncharacterized protein (DUF885 family)
MNQPGQAENRTAVAELADEYWEGVLRRSPTYATLLGDHRYDDQIDDLSAEAEVVERAELASIAGRLNELRAGTLEPTDRTSASLLANELSRRIAAIDLRVAELESDQMTGVHVGLLTSAPEVAAADEASARMLLERNRRIGEALEQAVVRFRAGLAADRTPARAAIARSLNTVESYLASSLDRDPLASYRAPEGWRGSDAWHEELRAVSRDHVRPAYERLRAVLSEELLPAARDDTHPGLCWLGDDGVALYQELVRQHTTLDGADPAEIHRIGHEQLARLAGEYEAIGSSLFGDISADEMFGRLRDDPELRYGSGDEIRREAETLVARATEATSGWFGLTPKTPCAVLTVPEVIAADAPSAYYFPPAQDGSRPGAYYVNLHEPQDRTRYETAAIAFHEAVPGHHLQIALATELEHLPRFQRLGLGNTAFVEGWALYAERLADEMGLYRDAFDRLGMLAADSWRSCRLVVDTGLHELGWTRQQAIDFMRENAPVSYGEITVEIDRYIAMPGQALGYKLGQLEIERLRARASAELGERFALPRFHDTVLGSGTVSLPVLAELVDAYIA